MVSSMTIETDRLRTELLSTSDKLTTCQTQLNLLDSQKTNTPVLYGGYVTHYCGFEDLHNCNYTMDTCTSSTVECWHRGTGRQDVYSGPVEDHTYGSPNGHYMYIDPTLKPYYKSSSSSHVPQRKARITTPQLPAANEYCVRFWYTMIGVDIGTLKVYAQVGGGDGYPVYTKTGQEDRYWHMAQVSLDSEYTSQPFKIVFEGTTSSYYTYPHSSHQSNQDTRGFISFDDVYIYNTSCSGLFLPPLFSSCLRGPQVLTTHIYTVHTKATKIHVASSPLTMCTSITPHVQLVFEGTTSSYYTYLHSSHQSNQDTRGFISFDDVYIYNTSCSGLFLPPLFSSCLRGPQVLTTHIYTVHTKATKIHVASSPLTMCTSTTPHVQLVFEGTTSSYYTYLHSSHQSNQDTRGFISFDDVYIYNTSCSGLFLPPLFRSCLRGPQVLTTHIYTVHTKATKIHVASSPLTMCTSITPHVQLVFEGTTSSYYTYLHSSHQSNQDTRGFISFDDVYIYNTSCSGLFLPPLFSSCLRGPQVLTTHIYTVHTKATKIHVASSPLTMCTSTTPHVQLVFEGTTSSYYTYLHSSHQSNQDTLHTKATKIHVASSPLTMCTSTTPHAQVCVSTSTIQLVFEGTTSSYYTYSHSSHQSNQDTRGFISFDDVYIYNTSCSAIPDCPAGSRKLVQGNMTSCYSFHIEPRSWYEAVDACKSEAPNGHLVSINSKLEQQFLVDVMQTNAAYTTAGQHGWYTSGNDERTEGGFKWTDTGYPYSLNYTNWHAGQPNNVGDAQDCLLLQYPSSDYEWGDISCADKHPFICEIQ
ncbi:MLRP2-like protein, partial [Mya arenaria]